AALDALAKKAAEVAEALGVWTHEVAPAVRELRELAGLSQRELSERLGGLMVSHLETGKLPRKHGWGLDEIQALAAWVQRTAREVAEADRQLALDETVDAE